MTKTTDFSSPKSRIDVSIQNDSSPMPQPPVIIPLTKERMQSRLTDLRNEFEAGQKMLGDLHTKEDELKATLLRISGAIQVLEELRAQEDAPKENE